MPVPQAAMAVPEVPYPVLVMGPPILEGKCSVTPAPSVLEHKPFPAARSTFTIHALSSAPLPPG
jgi:hypothetical protein